jgi:hypothetical protein
MSKNVNNATESESDLKRFVSSSEWISVDDRLPEKEGYYDFCINGKPAIEMNHWRPDDFFDPKVTWMFDWYSAGGWCVTHWKPKS